MVDTRVALPAIETPMAILNRDKRRLNPGKNENI
jgi:hypothetical protein